MDEIWFLEELVDGNPVWGIFETQLLRKQLLNAIILGLHHERIIGQEIGKGGYVATMLINNKLFVFSKKYRAYLLDNHSIRMNDANREIDVLPNPSGTLVLASGSLDIQSNNCEKIREANPNRKVLCINLKTLQIIRSPEIYYVHDNGGRPFKVHVADQVSVYKVDEENDSRYLADPLFIFKPSQVLIGISPITEMTKFSGGYGPQFDGNSILLRMPNGKYVFIGKSIFEFKPLTDIISFVSPVGNNDVPYPYAVDKDGNYYLLIEDVILQNFPGEEDPYDWYYSHHLITTDRGRIPPRKPVIENFNGIKEYYINQDQYTLTYTSKPNENYDRLTSEGEKMYLVDIHDNRILLDRKGYVRLMNDYGKKMGIIPFKKTVLQKRVW